MTTAPAPVRDPVRAAATAPSSQAARRRVRRTFTARGWVMLAVGCGLAALGLLFDERDLLLPAVVALLLPPLAWLATFTSRPSFAAAYRLEPEVLQAGERGLLHLDLRNTARRRSGTLDVVLPAVPGITRASRHARGSLVPGRAEVITIPLQGVRRGRYPIASPRLRVLDPLGLCQANAALGVTATLAVAPRPVALTGLPRSLSGSAEARGAQPGGASGAPQATLRPYVSGDDPRLINWRASARQEEGLLVRTPEAVQADSAAVILDCRSGGEGERAARSGVAEEGLERCVTMAASVLVQLLDRGVLTALVDQAGTVLATPETPAEALAALVDLTGSAAAPLSPEVPGRPDLIIAVAAVHTDADAMGLANARRQGATCLAFLGAEAAAAASAERARAVLASHGWHVTDLGADPALDWNAARRRVPAL
ncbi:DUF58 domain-containing protein [Serinibacter salmoneus]|uniref:Uncharacterized protein (DUF58 family) n=1 Tax=Serinibacter salmoneus TaxID=556530 RepID=A0A2A9CWF9_9MICO|nr:DUF58 domain-containing protein [Serinibacter salmoneus]PFG18471.1 uncharacterized protein (DUF58 family) [Serinibacter salmoneus]PFG21327.1 uncharacterized protein (DUF58 family) [Serinibacter salmoneus]